MVEENAVMARPISEAPRGLDVGKGVSSVMDVLLGPNLSDTAPIGVPVTRSVVPGCAGVPQPGSGSGLGRASAEGTV